MYSKKEGELTIFDDVKKGEKLMKNIESKIIKWLKNTMSELLSKSIKRKTNKRLQNKMSELGEIKISKTWLITKWVNC